MYAGPLNFANDMNMFGKCQFIALTITNTIQISSQKEPQVTSACQGRTLRIVRLPWTTESTCQTTEIPTPLVLQDK